MRLGAASIDTVAVMAGRGPADVVVSEGSFHVRAARERLGLADPAPAPSVPAPTVLAGQAGRADDSQAAKVTVTKNGSVRRR